jgi:chromosome segregation ATPase
MARSWRSRATATHDRCVHRRTVRRIVTSVTLVGVLGAGAAACSGGDTQGRQEPKLSEVEAQVAQLRLEVQSLRQEVKSLRESVPTTTTTTPGATNVSAR